MLVHESDRRVLPFALGFLLAIVVMSVVGALLRLPHGGYDMTGMWLIALSGAGSWLLGALVMALVLGRR